MSSTIRQWLTPIILVSIAMLVTFTLTANRPDNAKVENTARTLTVDVAAVVKQDLRIPIQAQGTVSPHRETAIVAEVAGKVIEVSPTFYAGGYVAKGDVLLRIDDVEHQAKLNRAQAAVASAESALAQEQGRADVAEQEFKKFPKKHRTSTARDLYLRKPQLKQAEAQLLSSQADLRKAEHDLERTVIRAPYDSLIREKQSDLGLYLTPGTPLATLMAVDFAEIRLAIPQSKLPYLELPTISDYDEANSTEVDLYTNVAGELQHWSANLHRTEGVYDERSRVLFVVARINDPYLLKAQPLNTAAAIAAAKQAEPQTPLRIGTFVSAVINGRLIENVVTLPRNVLRTGNLVWVIDQQQTLRNRKVSTLRTQGDKMYITGGLQNGDLVCLTPTGATIAGSKVTISSKTPSNRLFDQDAPAAESPVMAEKAEPQELLSTGASL
ncbi:efflux RND transporter periplasmic adaptor subunit [Oceanicoccus sagamiensis]|nr:efflux RND transporter periplasmic adaptor subunit [Oceanicoccus sagamiensis]